MENATKALLIAAAVLIVIVLIALGVALLNSGSDVTGQAKSVSESTSVQAFNAQFNGYLGKRQTAASVRSLMVAARASNKSNADQVTVEFDAESILVAITGREGDELSSSDVADLLLEGHSYEVTVQFYADDGRIENINVVDNNG